MTGGIPLFEKLKIESFELENKEEPLGLLKREDPVLVVENNELEGFFFSSSLV